MANTSFRDDVRKQNLGLGKLSISKKKQKQVKPVKVVNYNINAANCYVLTMMQYVHCLRIINNQSIAICRQIIRVGIGVEYFCDNIIYHHPTSVCIFLLKQCTKSRMEVVWKIVFHISYRNFSFHSISYHALVVDSILLLLLYFTPTVVASLKIRKRLILKKLLPLSALFQHFHFGVRFRFQPLLSSSSSYLFIYQVTSYHKKKLQLPLGLSPKHRNMQFL